MGFILDPLYNFVSGVIVLIHKGLTPIFGTDSGVTWTLSIMGLVVLIRIILIPLFVKQIKSQRALTALQPQMKEIQKKYKDDRQKQSEEMMKLYKTHKTNPLASCFPILAQAPIFFALFTVLNGIAAKTDEGVSAPIARGYLKGEYLESAAQAKFFGAKISETFLGSDDIKVKLVTVFLIFLMSATTFTDNKSVPRKLSEIFAPKNFACDALSRYSPLRNPRAIGDGTPFLSFAAIPLSTVKSAKKIGACARIGKQELSGFALCSL